MMDDLSVGKTEIAVVMILTMVIELILAYLAWGMMVAWYKTKTQRAGSRRRALLEGGTIAWLWLSVMMANFVYCGGSGWRATQCVHVGVR